MENTGKITTVVKNTKWYELKPLIVRRTTKKLEKWIANNLKRGRVKLETKALVSECDACKTLKMTIHWKIANGKVLHRNQYSKTDKCEYCWTRR